MLVTVLNPFPAKIILISYYIGRYNFTFYFTDVAIETQRGQDYLECTDPVDICVPKHMLSVTLREASNQNSA